MDIARIFDLQLANCHSVRSTTAKERIAKLRNLHRAILQHRGALEEALYKDLKKPVHEVGLTELYEVTSEIKHACSHLNDWMKPKRVRNPVVFFGAKAEVHFEPKGVVLILSPWNYPFQLAISPLVSAIAAGNCVMLKPSEISPNTSRFIKDLISSNFPENEIAVVEGDHSVATELLEMPFHHIFFTGSPAVGKIVMKAAAKHLASVTLELGGKSPVIVDDDFDLNEAARKIIWGKFLNAGQSCVAPDYLLIPVRRQDEFIEKAKLEMEKLYGDAQFSPDYCKVVSPKHQERLNALIRDAIEKGAHLEAGGQSVPGDQYLAPTILSRIPSDSKILTEEIFGPVLPVVSYTKLEDALETVNRKQKPLALYIFSRNRSFVEQVLNETSSGGVCINEVAVQFADVELPFGGANHSGIGNSHGYYGFKAFSHERAVLTQPKFGAMTFFYPPYTKRMKKLIDLTIKYL